MYIIVNIVNIVIMSKMKTLLIIFVGFVVITLAFHQTDYSINIERYNLLYFNKNYIESLEVKRLFVTRYKKKFTINLCVLNDLDLKNVNEHIEGRKFQSNEYRLFPFNYSQNSCAAMQNPLFGDYMANFNCSTKIRSCILKKGCFSCTNIIFDVSKFPPFAPRGRFKFIFRIIHKSNIFLMVAEAFIEIKPTNPLERVIGV